MDILADFSHELVTRSLSVITMLGMASTLSFFSTGPSAFFWCMIMTMAAFAGLTVIMWGLIRWVSNVVCRMVIWKYETASRRSAFARS